MRTHLREVVRRPSDLALWWDDLPMRHRWWWRILLLTEGEGWLRWKSAYRERIWYDPPDIDQWYVYPPLHRAWLTWTTCLWLPWAALRGHIRWREVRLSREDTAMLISEDRKRLWM